MTDDPARGDEGGAAQGPPVCPRHPDRVSYHRCQRCGRPACVDCQHPAPVGIHCVDCLREHAQAAPRRGGRFAPSSGRMTVTYTIMALCAVTWIAQLLVPDVTWLGQFAPVLGWSEPWRFLTAAFLHSPGAITHLGFNLMGLWVMGQFLEPFLGRGRFLALYLLSALGGSVGYLVLAAPALAGPDAWMQPTVGASGAVFGLFGAAVLATREAGGSVRGLLVLLAINAALPLVYPNIAWQAHLGGFVTGLAATGLLLTFRTRPASWGLAGMAGLAALLVAIAVATYGWVGVVPIGLPAAP